jgi:hypothetical protein
MGNCIAQTKNKQASKNKDFTSIVTIKTEEALKKKEKNIEKDSKENSKVKS